MYDYIKGSVEELNPAELVLECGGIGYKFEISLNSYEKFRSSGSAKVYVYHHLREDEETLYGFYDKDERWIFTLLISVSGIGPNTARMMLSSLTVQDVCEAIGTANVNKIKSVKGIGLKTAQRLIIELKDKVAKGSGASTDLTGTAAGNVANDAALALVSLGFSKSAVEKAIARILSENPESTLEEIVKKALNQL